MSLFDGPTTPVRETWVEVSPETAMFGNERPPRKRRRRIAVLLVFAFALVGAILVAWSVITASTNSDRRDRYEESRAEAIAARDVFEDDRSAAKHAIAVAGEGDDELAKALQDAKGYVDEETRLRIVAAVAEHQQGLERVVLPSQLPDVPSNDIGSSADLEKALAAHAQVKRAASDGSHDADGVYQQVKTLDAQLDDALEEFRASFVVWAETLSTENPDATEEVRAAAVESAARTAHAEDRDALISSLPEFTAAVDALRADQQRAVDAIAQERAELRRREALEREALEREARERQVAPAPPVPAPPVPAPTPTPAPDLPQPTPAPNLPQPTPAPDSQEPTPEPDLPESTPAPELPGATPAPDPSSASLCSSHSSCWVASSPATGRRSTRSRGVHGSGRQLPRPL